MIKNNHSTRYLELPKNVSIIMSLVILDLLWKEGKNCETHNRGEWFLLFSTYCDIKYLLRPVAICHHLSLFTTIYHYLSLSVTNCQYLSLSTKVTIKQATDGVAVKKTFPKAIENQDLNDHQ